MTDIENSDSVTYYHGTRADLKRGDLIAPGYASNYGSRRQANFVYLSATLDAAIWGAELAVGDGREGSTSSSLLAPSRMTPTSPTRGFPGIRRGHTARVIHCASSARSRSGKPPPSSSRRCAITLRS